MIRHRVFHPLLLAAYPVLALLAHNIDWLRPISGLRALLISVVGAWLLLILLARLLRDWDRAGILVSLLVILFYSYGQLYDSLRHALGLDLIRHRYLAPLYLAAAIALIWWIVKRLRRPESATNVLNAMALVVLAFPLFSLAEWTYSDLTADRPPAQASALKLPPGQPPDVYFLVVDGYARQDTLQKVFDLDNTPFLTFLRDHGFYVADAARSNYGQTGLSFSSSLNMNYVDQLVSDLPHTAGRGVLWNLIKHSEVRRQLESLGYETVAFSSGLAGTELTDADTYYTAGGVDEDLGLVGINPFEGLLIQTTLLRLPQDGVVALPRFVPGARFPYEVHRNRIRSIFARLKDLPESDKPKFVFAHIVAPHPPFVFAADGSPVTPTVPFTLRFTFDAGDPTQSDYVKGYRDQVLFVNGQLEEVINTILADSKTPPVIVLMGDHGPDSNSGRVNYVQERMTNLLAYHLPTGSEGLYPSVTPVNSFRIIFNQIFGGQYPILEDRVMYSEYDTPYDFQDVTDSIDPP
jgi:hypothetical protein